MILVEISFEKIKIEIQSLDQSYNERIKILNNILAETQESIKTDIAMRDEVLSSQKSLDQEIVELQSLKIKLTDDEKALTESVNKLRSDNEILTGQLTELSNSKLEVETQVNEQTKIADNLSANISDIETKIANVEVEITHAQNDSMNQTEQLEIEVNHVKQLLKIQNNYYKILKSLLKDNYISLPHFDVCKVITQQGVNNLDRLVMSSGVDKNTVTETLTELSVRGVLDFSKGSGDFSVIKEFTL